MVDIRFKRLVNRGLRVLGHYRFDLTKQRPFLERDMLKVPAGHRVGAPDYVGVATAKAGTSWWHSLLLEHPAVYANRLATKELSYFTQMGMAPMTEERIATYRLAFAAPPGGICGEWSPGYMMHPFALENLAAAAPDTKVLVLIRNPVDRAVSSMNQRLNSQAKALDLSRAQQYNYLTYLVFPYILGVTVGAGLKRLFATFPREQVLVLQYERCAADVAGELAKTYRFLGIDPDFKPQNPTRKVNAKRYVIDKPKSEERQRLAQWFAEDVALTKELVPDLDLSLWRDFV
jgi:hypothetical protein